MGNTIHRAGVVMLSIFIPSLALSLLTPLLGGAEPRLPPLAIGMEYREVIQKWGAPNYKEEHESSHVDIWEYSSAKVVFKEGRVMRWSDPVTGETIVAEPIHAPITANTIPERGPNDTVVEEILSEIMKDPGASDASDEAEVAPSPPSPAIRPQEIPPVEVIE